MLLFPLNDVIYSAIIPPEAKKDDIFFIRSVCAGAVAGGAGGLLTYPFGFSRQRVGADVGVGG